MARFKRITDYTKDELDLAVKEAEMLFGSDHFFAMLKGIDAYMERRRRIQKRNSYGEPDDAH